MNPVIKCKSECFSEVGGYLVTQNCKTGTCQHSRQARKLHAAQHSTAAGMRCKSYKRLTSGIKQSAHHIQRLSVVSWTLITYVPSHAVARAAHLCR